MGAGRWRWRSLSFRKAADVRCCCEIQLRIELLSRTLESDDQGAEFGCITFGRHARILCDSSVPQCHVISIFNSHWAVRLALALAYHTMYCVEEK